MNNTYYKTLDENFTQALNLYENEYTHNELIELLKTGNIVQKQIAVLRLEKITSDYDAQVILDNLTGQDGKVREAVSLKLFEFISDNEMVKFFQSKSATKVFLDAIIDINANICRNVINSVIKLKNDNNFCQEFCSGLVKMTLELLDTIEKFEFQEGKYKVNKEVFKLYWCLESLYEFYDKIAPSDLKNIILRSKNIQEYTIREKAAKILTHEFDDKELQTAKNELKNDQNYYVRNIFERMSIN